jgi:hypothetical protein
MANRTQPFTLDILTPHLKGFQIPYGGFDPDQTWQHTYQVYTLAGRGGRVGILNLHRRNTEDRNVLLEVNYKKLLPGQHTQIVLASIQCRDDKLATPLTWKYSSTIQNLQGKAISHTTLEKSAVKEGLAIDFKDGKTNHRIHKPNDYTINWALFDVVQRLPRRKRQTLSFTLLDHFDQVKPNQTLAYHSEQEVRIHDADVRLHRFDQLGEGIVPWIYWVDTSGRLFFVVSGLEAYILDTFPE